MKYLSSRSGFVLYSVCLVLMTGKIAQADLSHADGGAGALESTILRARTSGDAGSASCGEPKKVICAAANKGGGKTVAAPAANGGPEGESGNRGEGGGKLEKQKKEVARAYEDLINSKPWKEKLGDESTRKSLIEKIKAVPVGMQSGNDPGCGGSGHVAAFTKVGSGSPTITMCSEKSIDDPFVLRHEMGHALEDLLRAMGEKGKSLHAYLQELAGGNDGNKEGGHGGAMLAAAEANPAGHSGGEAGAAPKGGGASNQAERLADTCAGLSSVFPKKKEVSSSEGGASGTDEAKEPEMTTKEEAAKVFARHCQGAQAGGDGAHPSSEEFWTKMMSKVFEQKKEPVVRLFCGDRT